MSEELEECCKFCGNELCSCLDPDMNTNSDNYGKVILGLEEWEHHFMPIDNLISLNSSLEGIMFETYGEEMDFINRVYKDTPDCVWTYLDMEDGTTAIVNDFLFAGRIGYFVTNNPYDKHLNIIVKLDEEEDI